MSPEDEEIVNLLKKLIVYVAKSGGKITTSALQKVLASRYGDALQDILKRNNEEAFVLSTVAAITKRQIPEDYFVKVIKLNWI